MQVRALGSFLSRAFRLVRNGTAVLLLLAGSSSVALALGNPGGWRGGGTAGAPEIDPGSLGNAAALLSGGVLLLTGRRRRE